MTCLRSPSSPACSASDAREQLDLARAEALDVGAHPRAGLGQLGAGCRPATRPTRTRSASRSCSNGPSTVSDSEPSATGPWPSRTSASLPPNARLSGIAELLGARPAREPDALVDARAELALALGEGAVLVAGAEVEHRGGGRQQARDRLRMRVDLLGERVVPELADDRRARDLRHRMVVVAGPQLELVHAPVELGVQQREHAADVVVVDVREVDEVERLARVAQRAERGRDVPLERRRGAAVDQDPRVVGALEQQAVALAGLEDGEPHVSVPAGQHRGRLGDAGQRVDHA